MKSPQECYQDCQESQWKGILHLSTRMREYAEHRDWNALQSAIIERENLLAVYFGNDSLMLEIKKKMAYIEILKAIDKEILEFTIKSKDVLAREILKLQNVRNGLAAYTAGQPN